MSRPKTPDLTDTHRRRLIQFSRWLAAVADADDATRQAIVETARCIDGGGLCKADTLAAIDALDDLLSGVWDRRPTEDE